MLCTLLSKACLVICAPFSVIIALNNFNSESRQSLVGRFPFLWLWFYFLWSSVVITLLFVWLCSLLLNLSIFAIPIDPYLAWAYFLNYKVCAFDSYSTRCRTPFLFWISKAISKLFGLTHYKRISLYRFGVPLSFCYCFYPYPVDVPKFQ